MADHSSIPVIDNPFRQLGLHPTLVANASPTELNELVATAGRFFLKVYHPSQVTNSDPKELYQIGLKRTGVQKALEELSSPEGMRRALKEYRGLTPQGEVDRVSSYVEERQLHYKAVRDAYSKFLVERSLLPPEENVVKARNLTIQALDIVSLVNFSTRTSRELQKMFDRTLRIDGNGLVHGGHTPFFPQAPEKRAVAVFTVVGDDLSIRSIEKIFRHQGIVNLPPDHSIPDFSKGDPAITPWSEFSPVLGGYEIGRLTYAEVADMTGRLTAKLSKSSGDAQSFLITASRIPEEHIFRKSGYPSQYEIFYVEGMIRDIAFDQSPTPEPASEAGTQAAASPKEKRSPRGGKSEISSTRTKKK